MHSQLPSSLLKLLLITTHSNSNTRREGAGIILVSAHTNFCGTSWGDASSGCDDRQPCPEGTDEECTNGGICWADTNCDSAKGHGFLYDLSYITHSRFCGKGWTDANDNCSLKRHCPSGDPADCAEGEICFSHLAECNYIEMIGGPPKSAPGGGGGKGGNDPPRSHFCGYDWNDAVENCAADDHWCPNGADADCPKGKICFAETECKIGQKLPKNDASRSNFCGSDWNDALKNCASEDHWCPNGADEDCPDDKICFAGTECRYEADLFPTVTPTNHPTDVPTTPFPSASPSKSPVIYNTAEHTRFCGKGWEAVRDTCRIGSHCPSGSDAVCPGTQTCFSWVMGCNIVDFENHYIETGRQIVGSSHWLLPAGGLEGLEDVAIIADDFDVPTPRPIAKLPPSEFIEQYGGRYSGQPPDQGQVDEGAPTLVPSGMLYPLWDRIGCPEEYTFAGEYKDGSLVSTDRNVVYKCRPYPEEGYCIQHVPDSNFGYLGWELLGSCVGTFAPTPRPIAKLPPSEFIEQYRGEYSGQPSEQGQVDENVPVTPPPTSSAPISPPTFPPLRWVTPPPTSPAPINPPTFSPLRWVTVQPVPPVRSTLLPSKLPSKYPTPFPSSVGVAEEEPVTMAMAMAAEPDPEPPEQFASPPTDWRVCGADYNDAVTNCRENAQCPSGDLCPSGTACYNIPPYLCKPPTSQPTDTPTVKQTDAPVSKPPTKYPTKQPTKHPTKQPTKLPTLLPSIRPMTNEPTSFADSLVAGTIGQQQQLVTLSSNNNHDEDISSSNINNNSVKTQETWQQSNDPDSLCTHKNSIKLTGYKATLDCRGYVYCRDGYLMKGGAASESPPNGVSSRTGVIACRPQQLFDERRSVCTYWQDVNTNLYCPKFDGSVVAENLLNSKAPTTLKWTATVHNPSTTGSDDRTCSSNDHCRPGQFCYELTQGQGGYCGVCSADGAGCAASEICRIDVCRRQGERVVSICLKSWELDRDCGSGADDSISKYSNPESNIFFCGTKFADIKRKCLLSKPCPGGFASRFCDDKEGCFSVPSCAAEYSVATPSNLLSSPPPPNTNFIQAADHASDDCSLCGDSHLDWDASVFFLGEELSCHELESKIMLENAISEQCKTNQRLYFGTCCIQAPENPCHLCNSNGSRLNMKSNSRVSYAGEVTTCLDMYHFLYAWQEESSEHCIGAQGELIDLCCESTDGQNTPLYSFGASLSINTQTAPGGVSGGASPPLTTRPTQKPSSEFIGWYNADFMSHNASSSLVRFRSFSFLIVGLMMMT